MIICQSEKRFLACTEFWNLSIYFFGILGGIKLWLMSGKSFLCSFCHWAYNCQENRPIYCRPACERGDRKFFSKSIKVTWKSVLETLGESKNRQWLFWRITRGETEFNCPLQIAKTRLAYLIHFTPSLSYVIVSFMKTTKTFTFNFHVIIWEPTATWIFQLAKDWNSGSNSRTLLGNYVCSLLPLLVWSQAVCNFL